jgi:hypothetical protein
MSELNSYLAKMTARYQKTQEERNLAEVLFNDSLQINMGDQRLNSIAALTYNTVQNHNIFE